MKHVFLCCIGFVLLHSKGAGQIVSQMPVQSTNQGAAATIDLLETPNTWAITTVHFVNQSNLTIPAKYLFHEYSHDFQTLISRFVVDSLTNSLPIYCFSWNSRAWILAWENYSSFGFSQQGSRLLTLHRLSPNRSSIDQSRSIFLQTTAHSVHATLKRNKLIIVAGLDSSFAFPTQSNAISTELVEYDLLSNSQTSYTISERNGIYTSGTLRDVYFLPGDAIALGGVLMKGWPDNGSIWRQGYADLAIYDSNRQLNFNDVILADFMPNFPWSISGAKRGPVFNHGLQRESPTSSIFYYGTHRDTTHSNSGYPPTYGQQEMFLTKLSPNYVIQARKYFGFEDINDIAIVGKNHLAMSPNKKLYATFTTNFGAWLTAPDSTQKVCVLETDTSLNSTNYHFWDDGTDVVSVLTKAYPSGIYILANSVGRGGEKFHVLRIEGTAWASSSSQQVWPEWGVFPNPARERVFISGELPSNISLHDMQGRLLHQWSALENNELQLPALPPGIYLLHGSNAQGKRWPVRKLVVR